MHKNIQKYLLSVIADVGKTKTCSVADIHDALDNIRGSRIMDIVTMTEPGMRKTDNPYHGRVVKVAVNNVQVNFDYENAVNNRLSKEGADSNFEAKETWYRVVTRDDGTLTPWAEHKTNHTKYLRCRHLDTRSAKYFDISSGDGVDYATIEPFMPKKGSGRQGTINPVKVTVYGLDSLVAIKHNGELLLV